ncbi:hypothetical protein NLM33_05690 [Bradyrhizobium sp. CCGUVB1N3]|uniref:hypothetical protein n=1 Tax=Bradyrhizobium sp. CCGUVB1N3 TaxID=2949629 RepID=UPI0020B3FC2A|nr:hypothetical protein [Bradyrhizobium sp. CCGUVB1N3]MCP3469821.1 hypothetical protein [Bradyrhizobium sp. CCGUVB1N3]
MKASNLPTSALDLSAVDPKPTIASVDEFFEAWWRQYPRRVAKGAARKAFKRVLAKKIATFDQLMAGVMRYGAERAGEDPTFTKHPATWLNGECWTDEPQPKRPIRGIDSAVAGVFHGLNESDFRISRAAAVNAGFHAPWPDDDGFDF